jgi:ribosomal protein L11 methylase PrmA
LSTSIRSPFKIWRTVRFLPAASGIRHIRRYPIRRRRLFTGTSASTTASERDRAAAAIHDAIPQLTIESVDLPDEDWAARSQQSLTAVHAGAFIVAPPWDVPAESGTATVIVIEPSMGFGTGHHATTRMCLRLLSEIDVTDQTVLDLGTGSGVLSMAAALMGARRVPASTSIQDAINSAETSARLNTLPDTIAFQVSDFRHSAASPPTSCSRI